MTASNADHHHATCHQIRRRRQTQIVHRAPEEAVLRCVTVQTAVHAFVVPPTTAIIRGAVRTVVVVISVSGGERLPVSQRKGRLSVETVSGIADADSGHVNSVVLRGCIDLERCVLYRKPSDNGKVTDESKA